MNTVQPKFIVRIFAIGTMTWGVLSFVVPLVFVIVLWRMGPHQLEEKLGVATLIVCAVVLFGIGYYVRRLTGAAVTYAMAASLVIASLPSILDMQNIVSIGMDAGFFAQFYPLFAFLLLIVQLFRRTK